MITSDAPAIERAHDIRDLVSRTADRPRRIDRYIDYFGARRSAAEGTKPRRPYGSRAERAGSATPWSEMT